jgi:hypothetical protein
MKILGLNDSSFMQAYIPFVHCFRDGDTNYLEAIVKVSTGEIIEVEQKKESDVALYVNLNVLPSDSTLVDKTFQLIYIEPIPLDPESEVIDPDLNVIVDVITLSANPQEAGSAIVRYADIP